MTVLQKTITAVLVAACCVGLWVVAGIVNEPVKSPSDYHADQCSTYASTAFVQGSSGWEAAYQHCLEQ